MAQITGATTQSRSIENKLMPAEPAEAKSAGSRISGGVSEAQKASAVAEPTTISSLASRLSKAASSITQSTDRLDYKALNAKAEKNLQTILYPFVGEQKDAMAKQVPQPNDAVSSQSATAATAYLEGKGANPFAGLSREQLSTITNDDSGSFTVNERRAAHRQAHSEEEAWRVQVLAKATKEYEDSGKLTEFFKESLAHFMELPKMEQALYKEDYASDLQTKIKLDFNYFNHSAGDAGPSPGSLATLNIAGVSAAVSNIAQLLKFPG